MSNLSVNNATTENNRRIFVLLKVIPFRVTAENGRTLTTYGMLDSAAASSMITSNITDNCNFKEFQRTLALTLSLKEAKILNYARLNCRSALRAKAVPSQCITP